MSRNSYLQLDLDFESPRKVEDNASLRSRREVVVDFNKFRLARESEISAIEDEQLMKKIRESIAHLMRM